MNLTLQSQDLADYLKELPQVDFSDDAIQQLSAQLFNDAQTDVEKVKRAFEYVRDEIAHSWDIQSDLVTCTASEVLHNKQGICYAKSNLLAALLRLQGIPTGFCYQRLMLFDTPEKGYSLHALNGVYIHSLNKWIRLDARGNKEGVHAQFSTNEELLAFSVHPEYDEMDYPTIFVAPNEQTIDVLKNATNAMEMYLNALPDKL